MSHMPIIFLEPNYSLVITINPLLYPQQQMFLSQKFHFTYVAVLLRELWWLSLVPNQKCSIHIWEKKTNCSIFLYVLDWLVCYITSFLNQVENNQCFHKIPQWYHHNSFPSVWKIIKGPSGRPTYLFVWRQVIFTYTCIH